MARRRPEIASKELNRACTVRTAAVQQDRVPHEPFFYFFKVRKVCQTLVSRSYGTVHIWSVVVSVQVYTRTHAMGHAPKKERIVSSCPAGSAFLPPALPRPFALP